MPKAQYRNAYSPQLGLPALREAWGIHTAQRTGINRLPDPMVTVALTHGVSLCADLFTDPKTTVLIPAPSWGNYKAIFNLRRGAPSSPGPSPVTVASILERSETLLSRPLGACLYSSIFQATLQAMHQHERRSTKLWRFSQSAKSPLWLL